MKTATQVPMKSKTDFRSDARVYKLDPPLVGWDNIAEMNMEHEYVVVSAATGYPSTVEVAANLGHETYIFASDKDGNITSWTELEGSYEGGLDHARALAGAGYDVLS